MSTALLLTSTTLGWCGAIITAGAYALVSQRRLRADSAVFSVLNGVGACLLTVSAVAHASWPSAASNLVWALIALVALVRGRHTFRFGIARRRGSTRAHLAHLPVAACSDDETDLDDRRAA